MRKFIIISLSVFSIKAANPTGCAMLSKVDATGPKVKVCGQPERIVVGDTCRYSFVTPAESDAKERIMRLTKIPNIDCQSLDETVPDKTDTKYDGVVKMVWTKNKPSLQIFCSSEKTEGTFGNLQQEVTFEAKSGHDATVNVDNTVFAHVMVPRSETPDVTVPSTETSWGMFDFLSKPFKKAWNYISSLTSDTPKRVVSTPSSDTPGNRIVEVSGDKTVPDKLPRFEFYENKANDLCAKFHITMNKWLADVKAAPKQVHKQSDQSTGSLTV
jgi:hypothetical protein